MCIVLGVPLWWKTTEVYRVQLPYADITELTQAKVTIGTNTVSKNMQILKKWLSRKQKRSCKIYKMKKYLLEIWF